MKTVRMFDAKIIFANYPEHAHELMAATAHLHPREAIQYLTHAVLEAVGGELRDDATSLCFDWHGGEQTDKITHAGAEHRPHHERL